MRFMIILVFCLFAVAVQCHSVERRDIRAQFDQARERVEQEVQEILKKASKGWKQLQSTLAEGFIPKIPQASTTEASTQVVATETEAVSRSKRQKYRPEYPYDIITR